MTKTRIHGEIKDKFIIRSKSSGLLVTETEQNDGYLSFTRYPAVFNSEKDAENYLDAFNLGDEEREDISIENTDISFFDHGAVLITYENEECKVC